MHKFLDKRFHPRKELRQPTLTVEMWLPSRKEKNIRVVAQGLNISSGGVGIVVSQPLREGAVVKIEYPTGNGEIAIPIFSKVIWCKTDEESSRIGLKFLC